jgi:alpha-N-arabinofuranosidase
VKKVRGLLEGRIRVVFDEWNLRGWRHPQVDTGLSLEDYLLPQDLNDDNRTYTMADAAFTACFLNRAHWNAGIVGMANYAPAVNARGLIFTRREGVVLRPSYHVLTST